MKTWNEIKQEITTNFPDNNNKEITASRLRTVLDNVVDTAQADKDEIDDKTNIVVGVERKIGTWTEGGETYDLYEKVVNVGNLPNSGTLEVLHGITNKVRFVETSGFAYGNNNINIPFVNAAGAMFIYMGVGNTKITITTSSDRSGLVGYVTLRFIRAIA